MEGIVLIAKSDDMAIYKNQVVNTAKVGDGLSEVTDTAATKNRKKREARTRKKAEENQKRSDAGPTKFLQFNAHRL
jgi:hypothetical protein